MILASSSLFIHNNYNEAVIVNLNLKSWVIKKKKLITQVEDPLDMYLLMKCTTKKQPYIPAPLVYCL